MGSREAATPRELSSPSKFKSDAPQTPHSKVSATDKRLLAAAGPLDRGLVKLSYQVARILRQALDVDTAGVFLVQRAQTNRSYSSLPSLVLIRARQETERRAGVQTPPPRRYEPRSDLLLHLARNNVDLSLNSSQPAQEQQALVLKRIGDSPLFSA